MCGIVGIFNVRAEPREKMRADLHRMASRLVHRGPDGAGFTLLAEGRLGLAQTRLSIVDIEGGQQPLVNEDGQLVLVANGEIYEAERWRRELEAKGHRFASRSDSEVLLHLYEEYGVEGFQRLSGEYAFLLWDGHRQELFAVRDLLGVKPLFYAQLRGRTLFASEAKALLALEGVSREADPDYFTGTLMGSLEMGPTAFLGVKTILPGTCLRVDLNGQINTLVQERPSFVPEEQMDFVEAQRECRRLLEQAVARRLVADVPVHVYMSGGLDSTSVAALMRAQGQRPTAFSVSFPGSEMDESALVRSTAKALDLDLDILSCPMDSLADNLMATLGATESPIGNLNSVAKFLLAQHVHQRGVKVCLTGEGADELFAGYAFWKQEALQTLQQGGAEEQAQAKELIKVLLALEKRNEGILWQRSSFRSRGKRAYHYGYPSYYRSHSKRMDRVVPWMFRAEVCQRAGRRPSEGMEASFPREAYGGWHPLNMTRSMALAALHNYIIPFLGDRVEMAHALECRTPFMDRDLVNFLGRVPPRYLLKIEAMREKFLLYETMKDLLPPAIYAGHKHPFLSPSWGHFAKTRRGRELIEEFMSPRALRETGLFEPRRIGVMKLIWQVLPLSSSLRKSLDVGIGVILTAQIWHHLFITHRPEGRLLSSFRERQGLIWKES